MRQLSSDPESAASLRAELTSERTSLEQELSQIDTELQRISDEVDGEIEQHRQNTAWGNTEAA